MTRTELISLLEDIGVPDPRAEAKMLICELFDISPAAMLAEPMRDYESSRLEAALERRRQDEPVQYIIGKAYFCGETYFLNDACLIPRADTELLCETAAKMLPENARFADLFCGSGCVGISLCKLRPDAVGIGVDISAKALEMAKKNAEYNGADGQISFVCGDVTKSPLGKEKFALITANPPYITAEEMKALSLEVLREPHLALYGGEDGLDLFSAMLEKCGDNLADGGLILCEIGYSQGESATLAANRLGFDCEIIPDISGNARVALLRKRIN